MKERLETRMTFSLGAVAILVLASVLIVLPTDESDGATSLGTFTSLDMSGGSEQEYYNGVNISDPGLVKGNYSKTIYVLAGGGIFITSWNTSVNRIVSVDGGPSSSEVPSGISWNRERVTGNLEPGESIRVFMQLQDVVYEADLTFVAVEDPGAAAWPGSFTNLGNYECYLSRPGDSSSLYTSVVFDSAEIGYYGFEQNVSFDLYIATGAYFNIGGTDIATGVSSCNIPGTVTSYGVMYGIVDDAGNYTLKFSTTSATVTFNVHVIKVLKSFTVEFISNGGSSVASQLIESGQCALSPDDPTLYGFTFKGWFTDNGTFLNEWNFSDPVTGDMTLYAKWEGGLEFTTDPIADGMVTAVEGSPGTAIFAATGSQNYNTVFWDFGDGTTSTNTYATHYYSEPGTYTATLTVYNNHGSDTMEFLIEVPGDDSGDGVPWTIVIAAVLALVIIGVLIARYLL